jgi:hypothetical protein
MSKSITMVLIFFPALDDLSSKVLARAKLRSPIVFTHGLWDIEKHYLRISNRASRELLSPHYEHDGMVIYLNRFEAYYGSPDDHACLEASLSPTHSASALVYFTMTLKEFLRHVKCSRTHYPEFM